MGPGYTKTKCVGQVVTLNAVDVQLYAVLMYLFYSLIQIASGLYEVDTMSCAGDDCFYIPSRRFAGEKVWYLENIKAIIPEPLPSSSSARQFCVVPEIWAKCKKKTPAVLLHKKDEQS